MRIRLQQLTRNSRLLSMLSWLLALSFASGSDLFAFPLGGISWSFFRIVVMLIAALGLIDFSTQPMVRRSWPSFLAIAWLLWFAMALLPIYPIQDISAFMKDVFYLMMGGAIWMALHYLVRHGQQAVLFRAAYAGLIVNLIVGLVQVFTSIQPASAHMEQLVQYSAEHFVRFAPVGMFGNPNHFAFYLCVHLVLMVRQTSQKWIGLQSAVFAVMSVLLWLTAGRLAMVVWAMVCLIAVYEHRLLVKRFLLDQWATLAAVVLLLAALTIGIQWHNTRSEALAIKRAPEVSSAKRVTSESSRMALLTCAWTAVKETKGIGLGPGQFESYVVSGRCAADTGSMTNAHSGVAEVASQYGVIVFALLCLVFASTLYFAHDVGAVLWCIFFGVSFIFLQALNSSFLASPVSWVYMALPLFVLHSSPTHKN